MSSTTLYASKFFSFRWATTMQYHCKSLYVIRKNNATVFEIKSYNLWNKLKNNSLHQLSEWHKLFFNNTVKCRIIHTFITKVQKFCLTIQVTSLKHLHQQTLLCFFCAGRVKYLPAWPLYQWVTPIQDKRLVEMMKGLSTKEFLVEVLCPLEMSPV